jgi:hypothetical protein
MRTVAAPIVKVAFLARKVAYKTGMSAVPP